MQIKNIFLFSMIVLFTTSCTQTANNFPVVGQCGVNLVANPSFEDPVTVVDMAYLPQIPSWNIEQGGNIEIDKNVWSAPDGKQSVDLNALSLGGISQNIRTKANQAYTLSFYLAGNPSQLSVKRLEVIWGNNSLGVFEFTNDATTSKNNMKFELKTVNVPANLTTSEITKISFISGTPGPSGAVIDNVMVKCN